jgi:4-amino-4-deoxy-L-arabinose transferase-like glycosyltransferase
MVVLFLAGLAIRVAFVLAVHREALGFNDTLFYHASADQLAHGKGYSDFNGAPTARWPPAYTFILSLVYRVFGTDYLGGELLNTVLGAAAIPLLMLIALRVFGRREALVAGVVLAFFPGQILYTEVLLSETFYSTALLVVFALLAVMPHERKRTVLAVGMAIGVCTLIRGEGPLLLAIPLAVWWPELSKPALARRMALVLAGTVLVVAPWTIRNALVMHDFIPLSTNGGTTFWSGHNPRANGGPTYATPELLRQAGPAGNFKTPIRQEALLRHQALEFMLHNPRRELELIPMKLAYLNRGDSAVIDIWINSVQKGPTPFSEPNRVRIGALADFAYFSLLFLTIAAVVLVPEVRRNRVTRGVLGLFAAALVFYGFVLYGNFRYRASLEPLMILLAAPLLVRMWELRSRAAPPTTR